MQIVAFYIDSSVIVRKFNGVVQKIVDDLLKSVGIGFDKVWHGFVDLNDDSLFLLTSLHLVGFNDFLD
jgi:hypothetical protein